ncbi:tyrosine-type recombinase/integrase [Tumebacillus algifaecis]|nr:tyrosine-type recombinase/integrase [Tumebacillus algifaecis]
MMNDDTRNLPTVIGAQVPSMAQEMGILHDEHLITLFLNRPRPKQWSKMTRKAYHHDLEAFLKFIDGTPLAQVTYVQLVEYCYSLQHYASATQQRMINVMRSLFLFAHRLGYMVRNPSVLIAAPRVPIRATHKRSLSVSEAQKLLETARRLDRAYLMVVLLITTGVRVEELCQGNWGDLYEDMRGNIGWMVRGKGDKDRPVLIRPDVWALLQEFRIKNGLNPELDHRDKTPLIFTRRLTRYRQNGIRDMMYRLSDAAGLSRRISPHILRHTCATFSLEAEAPLLQVQRQMGHESLRTTERYLHDIRELSESAGAYINQVSI